MICHVNFKPICQQGGGKVVMYGKVVKYEQSFQILSHLSVVC